MNRALSFAVIALMACIGYELMLSTKQIKQPAQNWRGSTPSVTLPKLADVPAFAMYAEISARPLFSPVRRPTPSHPDSAPKTADTGKPASPLTTPTLDPARYQLSGISIAPALKLALVLDNHTHKEIRLQTGAKLAGWTVTDIEPNQIRLKNAGVKSALVLLPSKNGIAQGATMANYSTAPMVAPAMPVGRVPVPSTANRP